MEFGGGALNESDEAGNPPLKEEALRPPPRYGQRRAHGGRAARGVGLSETEVHVLLKNKVAVQCDGE